ncbi:TPA: oligosaccharide flippase family protein [Vibrio alginolyticus]|nr:oligosaccharide flippase family protein [Vibrio alginolyticus]
MLSSVIALMVITRFLEPNEYAKYQELFIPASIFSNLMYATVNGAYSRWFYGNNESIKFSLYIVAFNLILSLIVFYLFDLDWKILFIAHALGIALLSNTYARVNDYNILFLYQNLSRSIIYVILVYILLKHYKDYNYIVISLITSCVIVSLITIKSVIKHYRISRELVLRFKTYISFGLQTGIATGVTVINLNLDKLIVSKHLKSEIFGAYVANSQFVEFAVVAIFSLISSIVYPELVKKRNDSKSILNLIAMYINCMSFLGVMLIAIVHFFGKEIVSLALGDGYSLTSIVLVYITLNVVLSSLKSNCIDIALNIMNKVKFIILTSLTSLILFFVFSLKLSNSATIEDIVLIGILSKLLACFLSLFFIYRNRILL